MTWVRKVPGVRNLPRWLIVRPKTRFTLSGRPMSGLSRISCPGDDPPGRGPVQGHGGGELNLVHRQLPAVAGVLVGAGERLRQPGQPLAGQPVDLLIGQPVADPLDRRRVADRAERVVQPGERDPGLEALLLGVLVTVDGDLPGVREVAAELDEERAEISAEAMEIPVAGHRLVPVQPRVPLPVTGSRRREVRHTRSFSLATPANTIWSPPDLPARQPWATWSLLGPLANRTRSSRRGSM